MAKNDSGNGGSADNPDWLPPEINTGTAHSARVYDYWLGGKDNFAADRALGDAILAEIPSSRFARTIARADGIALATASATDRSAAKLSLPPSR